MTEALDYRLAVANDLTAVYDLYMDEASNPFLTYDPMPKKEFEPLYHDLLNTKTLFVAVLANEVVATYRLISKTHRQAHVVYLGGFSIKSSCKGKGIGTRVLQHICDYCASQGKKRIELTVDIHNEPAIRLYRKLGFEKEGYIKKSYATAPSGTYYDEYLMAVVWD